jgi:hypothetical protein
MIYRDGSEILLGDIVEISMPDGPEIAKVVMLGENYEHLDIDKTFTDWVHGDRILGAESIVIEWIDHNPLEHNDPKYAPVGNYMFTGISSGVKFIQRSKPC